MHTATCGFVLGPEGPEDQLSPFFTNCFAAVAKKLEGAGFTVGRLVAGFPNQDGPSVQKLICTDLLHRSPLLGPLRVEFPLMYPKLYIGLLCRELIGLGGGLPSSCQRADPNGFFRDCRHHTTDTRLDPKVRDETGALIRFADLRKGDVVRVRLVMETRLSQHSGPRKPRVDLQLRPQAITVVEREKKMVTSTETMHCEGFNEQETVAPVSDLF